MKKLISVILVLAMFLSIPAQAGTISKAISTVTNKIEYITAKEFVTSLLLGTKVKPDKPLDYWGKAVSMGLIPGEVKKDKPLTRAQASYIVWKLINAVPELKDKNIPVKTVVLSPVDYTFWTGGDPTHNFRGAYVAWGPGDNGGWGDPYTRFNSKYAVMAYDLVVIDKYYKDGTVKTVHVWNRLKDYFLPLDWSKVLQRFMRENPDKVKFDLPAERLKAQVWVLGHNSLLGGFPAISSKEFLTTAQNRQLYTLHYEPVDKAHEFFSGCYTFFTLKSISKFEQPNYYQIFLNYVEFGKYKSTNINDWQWTAELNPITNEALNKWLMKIPRKFPLDYTRFKYFCNDFGKIPTLYQEPMLRLADLGIITPEANVDEKVLKSFKLLKNIDGIIHYPPKMDMPDIRFNAGKLLTRAEAIDIITRVFDESKRVVFDDLTFKEDTIDDYGYNYGFKKRTGSEPNREFNVLYYHVGKTVTYRIDELWQLLYVKYDLTQKFNIVNATSDPKGIVFYRGYGSIGTMSNLISLYDGTI
ncbi:hypothetical protein ACAG39_01820 [Caldicellulosiruptoraceae bacterium PP1]